MRHIGTTAEGRAEFRGQTLSWSISRLMSVPGGASFGDVSGLAFQTEPAAEKELPAMQHSIFRQFKQIPLNVRTFRSRNMNKRRIIPVGSILPMLTVIRATNSAESSRPPSSTSPAESDFESRFMIDHHEIQLNTAEMPPQGGDASAVQVVASIRRAADLIEELLTVDFSAFRLNKTRFAALQFIGQSSAQGCSQTELATSLGQSESSVSGLVSRMRADGLLYRLRTKHDQRKRLLMLSERGRQLLADCELAYGRQFENVLSRFEADWLEQLSGLLDVFSEKLATTQAASEIDTKRDDEQPIRSNELLRRSA